MRSKLFLVCFFTALSAMAQDAFVLNPLQALVYVNPSFAGENGGLRAQSLSAADNQGYMASGAPSLKMALTPGMKPWPSPCSTIGACSTNGARLPLMP